MWLNRCGDCVKEGHLCICWSMDSSTHRIHLCHQSPLSLLLVLNLSFNDRPNIFYYIFYYYSIICWCFNSLIFCITYSIIYHIRIIYFIPQKLYRKIPRWSHGWKVIFIHGVYKVHIKRSKSQFIVLLYPYIYKLFVYNFLFILYISHTGSFYT